MNCRMIDYVFFIPLPPSPLSLPPPPPPPPPPSLALPLTLSSSKTLEALVDIDTFMPSKAGIPGAGGIVNEWEGRSQEIQ